MLNISSSQSLNAFQGLKKVNKTNKTTKEEQPSVIEDKSGKTAAKKAGAVTAALAMAALVASPITSTQAKAKNGFPESSVSIKYQDNIKDDTDGKNGPDGRGITAVESDEESGELTVYYNDGSEDTFNVEGMFGKQSDEVNNKRHFDENLYFAPKSDVEVVEEK